MDWESLRSAAESWLECDDTQGAHDLSHFAQDFIPERPLDPADAEWLETLPDWSQVKCSPIWLWKTNHMVMDFANTPHLSIILGDGEVNIHNPTRIQVALFEAALSAGVMHD